MPTLSWSIPAETCKLGSLLHLNPKSVCHNCYAMKGCYTFKSTVDAMNRRFEILMRHQRDGSWDEWVNNWQRIFDFRLQQTNTALSKGKPTPRDDGKYWRWEDSGDLQSVEHFASLCRIAEICPDVDFWLPTKEAGMVSDYLDRCGNPETAIPTNMCVRISVPLKDRAPQGSLLLLLARSAQIAFAGCHTGGHHDGGDFIMDDYDTQECDAYLKEGECADCRDCWSAYNVFVSYPEH
jgi:hypothetical protein